MSDSTIKRGADKLGALPKKGPATPDWRNRHDSQYRGSMRSNLSVSRAKVTLPPPPPWEQEGESGAKG